MKDQERPHLTAGLSSRLVDNDGFIIRPAWTRAVDGKELVGSCRQPQARGGICPGFLTAGEPEQVNQKWWFTATCLKCQHEYVAPNGKTLPRTSARSDMPEGGWERRMKSIDRVLGKDRT